MQSVEILKQPRGSRSKTRPPPRGLATVSFVSESRVQGRCGYPNQVARGADPNSYTKGRMAAESSQRRLPNLLKRRIGAT
jgi:hypothetical protein